AAVAPAARPAAVVAAAGPDTQARRPRATPAAPAAQ
ncbi:SPOR domain-containing protein, partial [Burkholderia pseudomallei]|nr:SPOR domain-containing protein [Burkholderia pseudomallei]